MKRFKVPEKGETKEQFVNRYSKELYYEGINIKQSILIAKCVFNENYALAEEIYNKMKITNQNINKV